MSNTKAQIAALFPGEENKGVRHRLYSTPDLLKGTWTDDQLRALAAEEPAAPVEEPTPDPTCGLPVAVGETAPKEGEILTLEQQIGQTAEIALHRSGGDADDGTDDGEDQAEQNRQPQAVDQPGRGVAHDAGIDATFQASPLVQASPSRATTEGAQSQDRERP